MQFFAACKKAPVFCIITEYLAGGSLRKYLHHQEPHSVPLNLVLKLALDIARGMQYLHSQGILHRDLKSENLLLGEDMCVKVADFGISCLESQCGSTKGFTGTYRWMAPEMIKEKHHTKKVDVYSFGIVLWELLTALIPFDNMTPEQAAFAVSQKVCTWWIHFFIIIYIPVRPEINERNLNIHIRDWNLGCENFMKLYVKAVSHICIKRLFKKKKKERTGIMIPLIISPSLCCRSGLNHIQRNHICFFTEIIMLLSFWKIW